MFIEADFTRFYNITPETFPQVSWRRFQTLLTGLQMFEDSGWRRITQTATENTPGDSWTPPVLPAEIAPDVESGQKLLERMFLNQPGG